MNFIQINPISRQLLKTVAGYKGEFKGAYNIRQDSGCAGRHSTENIKILPHSEGKPGIEIHVAAGSKGESVYIPATVTRGNVNDLTYNDFYIGEGAQVTIVAGCGVHTDNNGEAVHKGIHRFFVGRSAEVIYEEKHIGEGDGSGRRRIDPVSEIYLEEDARMTIDTLQIGGVDLTERVMTAALMARSKLLVRERLLTDGSQHAKTRFDIVLEGDDSGCDVISRSVARGKSRQEFLSRIIGKARCVGHSSCDAILSDEAVVIAAPQLDALSPDAALIHEAAIGKIAGEQILKLRTLGLTEVEAEEKIVEGFLK